MTVLLPPEPGRLRRPLERIPHPLSKALQTVVPERVLDANREVVDLTFLFPGHLIQDDGQVWSDARDGA